MRESEKFPFLLTRRGNVPGATMNLPCTGSFLSNKRSMEGNHQIVLLEQGDEKNYPSTEEHT